MLAMAVKYSGLSEPALLNAREPLSLKVRSTSENSLSLSFSFSGTVALAALP
jgi:hypothetical protein